MSTLIESIIELLSNRFPDIDLAAKPLLERERKEDRQICVRIPADRLLEVMGFLREDGRCCFDQLADLTCVDYLNFPQARDRFAVVYALLSTSTGCRLWVKCFVNDPEPQVPSVTGIWWGADWLEREVYDMFGIRFTGHPDLRRILTWDGFDAHPLRKDYPYQGRGEREDFKVVQRDDA